MTYNEMELRGTADFLDSVGSYLCGAHHDLFGGKCARCEAIGEVQHAKALVDCDLAFYEMEHQ